VRRTVLAVAVLATLACLGEERPARGGRGEAPDASTRPPIPDVEDRGRPSDEEEGWVAETDEGEIADPILAWRPPHQGTVGIVDEPSPTGRVATLVGVETGRHPTFDRIVFTFAGADPPGYHLEYVDRPVRRCGSGEPVELPGDGWLEVRLEPAAAHDEEGRPTVGERRLEPAHPMVREAVLTCDFEAVVTWVLAVESPNRYRVLELEEPSRLAVDVRHE